MAAGKDVFVEKPIAITRDQLSQIEEAYDEGGPRVMVGFNRRFAPTVKKMKSLLDTTSEPRSVIYTVNAGAIPANHWTQDREVGGGRFIGEGCHFVDLLRFLAGSPIKRIQAMMMGDAPGIEIRTDKTIVNIEFEDGSIGSIQYLADGHKSFPKERIDVFCGGKALQLDNFRKLTGYGWSGFKSLKNSKQDKGQDGCSEAFVTAISTGGPSPIPFDEIMEVHKACFDVDEQCSAG